MVAGVNYVGGRAYLIVADHPASIVVVPLEKLDAVSFH
jgi:hypothetical protein